MTRTDRLHDSIILDVLSGQRCRRRYVCLNDERSSSSGWFVGGWRQALSSCTCNRITVASHDWSGRWYYWYTHTHSSSDIVVGAHLHVVAWWYGLSVCFLCVWMSVWHVCETVYVCVTVCVWCIGYAGQASSCKSERRAHSERIKFVRRVIVKHRVRIVLPEKYCHNIRRFFKLNLFNR